MTHRTNGRSIDSPAFGHRGGLCIALVLTLTLTGGAWADDATRFGRSLAQWQADLADGDTGRRATAVRVIGMFGNDATPILTQALQDGDVAVRAAAAEALAIRGKAESQAAQRLNALRNDPSFGVQLAAAFALCRMAQPSDADLAKLTKGVEANSRPISTRACDYLARVGPPAKAALPVLQPATKAKDYHIWGAALIAIDEIEARQ